MGAARRGPRSGGGGGAEKRAQEIKRVNETEESIWAAPDYHVNDEEWGGGCGKEAFLFSHPPPNPPPPLLSPPLVPS